MTNTDKLSRAITLMKECQKFKAPFLTTPISLVSEVLEALEEEDKWYRVAAAALKNTKHEFTSVSLAGYLFEGKFITDLSSLNGVTMHEGNHPIPLYRKEK